MTIVSFSLATQARKALFRCVGFLLLCGMGTLTQVQAQTSSIEMVGLVYPVADVEFGVSVAGVVQQVLIKPGQTVKTGQPLLEIESQAQKLELQRRILVAEDASELDATATRLMALDEMLALSEMVASRSQSVSKEELTKQRLERMTTYGRLQQLKAQKSREQVELALAQLDLEQRTLRAPRDGMVVESAAVAGEWAKPGDALFRLVDIRQVELRLSLPQLAARGMRVGQKMTASFETGGEPVQVDGVVHFVSPLADAASGLVDARLRFANPKGQIRPGAKGQLSNLVAIKAR
jgi:RND family efflux transporter MFP subunit